MASQFDYVITVDGEAIQSSLSHSGFDIESAFFLMTFAMALKNNGCNEEAERITKFVKDTLHAQKEQTDVSTK